MKKLLALLCAMTLLFSACAQAGGEYAARWGGETLLTVSYDGGRYRLDTESYLYASTPTHRWLGMFYDGEFTIELGAERFAGLDPAASPEELSAFLCAALAADGAEPVEVWHEGALPFAVLKLRRPSGESYYAAALVSGCAVYFEIYNLRGGVDARALDALKALLAGAR